MDLESLVRAHVIPEQGMQIVNSAGRRQAYFPANKSRHGPQSFTSDFEILRGDLCRIMYEATKSRVKYIFGSSIQNFEDKGTAIEVRFADETTDQFDILVDADGQRSCICKMTLASDAVDALRPFDEYVAHFTILRPMDDGEEYIATTIQVFLTGKSVTERLKNVRKGDDREEKSVFVEVFKGAEWQVDSILESLMDAEDFYCECQGLFKLEPWYQSRVVLLGDAAYGPSASTDMGTSSGLLWVRTSLRLKLENIVDAQMI
ncbi:fad binding domain protein [Penicillium macrosclerotiorum]|uniref:fad binding domain protein n=1 Tax=Penicillium macrosclerotiorum TaxID=303699 RepID=UPI0025472590|nr:fad binding domain protein [Penicillium macrosclerotiorum]KAJ5679096.1 fad binding domain protein [Penicillium macrosclerotiorum]